MTMQETRSLLKRALEETDPMEAAKLLREAATQLESTSKEIVISEEPVCVESFNEALDKVIDLRAAWKSCIGALYKNVMVGVVQSFLEKCIKKFGPRFMECVVREYLIECYGESSIEERS